MGEYRRYNKRQKLSVVMAAEMSGLTATADATGIPKSTIAYWMDRPEFAEIRTKTRAELADEIKVVAHLAWQRTGEALRDGTMEPRDVLFAAEKATTLQLLMAGEATGRIESVNLTDDLPADTKRELRARLARSARGESELGGATGDPVGTGAAVDS